MGPLVRIRSEAGEEALELEEFEARVRRGELAGRCPVSFEPLTGQAWVRADQLEIFRRLHQPRRLYFARAFNLGRFPALTAAFVAADLLLFAALSAQGPVDQGALVAWGAKCWPLMADLGQLWRLLTANLLHENWLHIAFNLFVLFNLGGALENAFRPLDYLSLLFASALGASLASTLALPQAVSVGASGMVYGTLGAAVVFGLKYRSLLPKRYRRILGEATIPTVLVFLYIGFTATGVDNWAHLGGLASGSALALFLKPRLLQEAFGLEERLRRLVPIGLSLLAIGLAGPWLRGYPLLAGRIRDDALGVELEVPGSWRRAGSEGLSFDNGLGSVGRAAVRVGASPAREPASPERLLAEGVAGGIGEVAMSGPLPAQLLGRAGQRYSGSYRDDEGELVEVELDLVEQGERRLFAVFEWPARYPDYRRVLERVRASLTLAEPRPLREARGRALLDPSAGQLEALSRSLSGLGDEAGAAAARGEAERLRAQQPGADAGR